jgi:hypothetical protein
MFNPALSRIGGLPWRAQPSLLFQFRGQTIPSNSSVARVEALTLAAAHKFIDAFLWEIDNELALGRHHREDLAIHFESARAEALPPLPADTSVVGEGFYDGHKPRIDLGRIQFIGLLLRGHDFNLAALLTSTLLRRRQKGCSGRITVCIIR